MRKEMKDAFQEAGGITTEARAKPECCHYWLIESPNGSRSHGICKFCNEEREFDNLLYHYSTRARRPFSEATRPNGGSRQIMGIHRFPLA